MDFAVRRETVVIALRVVIVIAWWVSIVIVISVKHFLFLRVSGQEVWGQVTTLEIIANANDPIACLLDRQVENEGLDARLANEPATLACERETKAIFD